jgi:hypothetical protein
MKIGRDLAPFAAAPGSLLFSYSEGAKFRSGNTVFNWRVPEWTMLLLLVKLICTGEGLFS